MTPSDKELKEAVEYFDLYASIENAEQEQREIRLTKFFVLLAKSYLALSAKVPEEKYCNNKISGRWDCNVCGTPKSECIYLCSNQTRQDTLLGIMKVMPSVEEIGKVIKLSGKELADKLNNQNFSYENTSDDGEWLAESLEDNLIKTIREQIAQAIHSLMMGRLK